MVRPHDLLFPRGPDAFRAAGERPGWLDALAPLVVRREGTAPGIAAVGARGLHRNERCKGYVALADVADIVTPRMLAQRLPDRPDGDVPACIGALHALAPRLDALAVDWGPAGGAGYWLACGLPVLRATSDLDLLVRLPRRPSEVTLATLAALMDGQPCRTDLQVERAARGGQPGISLRRVGRTATATESRRREISLRINTWPWRCPR